MATFNTFEYLQSIVATSQTVQLFLVSTVVLSFGLALRIWYRAVKLTFVDDVPLSHIEKSHPHLPSTKAVLTIALSHVCFALLVVAAFTSATDAEQPVRWLVLACVLMLTASACILAELQWASARLYAVSFTMGTAIALAVLTIRSPFFALRPIASVCIALPALAVCVVMARMQIQVNRSTYTVKVVALLTCVLWLSIFLR